MRKKTKAVRAARRESAVARNTTWTDLTPAQQLAALERRGHGHCRQAEMLREKIERV